MSAPTLEPALARQASAAELAAAHGLVLVGGRPPLGDYLRRTWQRRHFARELARAKAYAVHQNSYLGQLWTVLTPLLWAGVYLVVFGVMLGTSRGVGNYVGFLLVGVFLFRFLSSAMSSGATAVVAHRQLVSTLQFPRALLPAAVVTAELLALVPALLVLLALLPLTGETPSWRWLLLPAAVLLQWLFGAGVAFVLARLVSQVRDVAKLIPFVLRALLYASGVFFSIETYGGSGWAGWALQHQPVALYLSLSRSCLLADVPLSAEQWLWGAGWAVAAAGAGLWFFWRGEEHYGRD